jgi:hypothetical protein
MRRRKISKRASSFIGRVIRRERLKGTPPKKAAGIAYSMARKKGYKIPRRSRR